MVDSEYISKKINKRAGRGPLFYDFRGSGRGPEWGFEPKSRLLWFFLFHHVVDLFGKEQLVNPNDDDFGDDIRRNGQNDTE